MVHEDEIVRAPRDPLGDRLNLARTLDERPLERGEAEVGLEAVPARPLGAATRMAAFASDGRTPPPPTCSFPTVAAGRAVHLADFKGKTVVLEWFNPHCPFVKNAHTKGSLKDAARRHVAEGVVWLGVNSGAPGKEGAGADATREGKRIFSLDHPILIDASGDVGHAYGATNTPNLYVIDKAGTLVYRGAVDNSPDGEGESPTDGKLVSYVDAALADLAAGRPVATPSTKPYGCSVKYARR